jgi:uncharacterized membrane protein
VFEMPKSKVVLGIAAMVLILIIGFAAYAGLTYPRAVLTIPVSFTIGAEVATEEFDQPILNNKVQVQIAVESGAALWRARILSGDQVLWEHTAAQSEQTSYDSGWFELREGHYNFTFGTIGIGSLKAAVTVSSRDSFW